MTQNKWANNIPLKFITLIYSIKICFTSLPEDGRFILGRFLDDNCTTLDTVLSHDPQGLCWSTAYDNGLKPLNYNETTKELTIRGYEQNSCYGSEYEDITVQCDNVCHTVHFPHLFQNIKSFSCSYLRFKRENNFTFERYHDSECKQQVGLLILKDSSTCWDLGDFYEEPLSISPIKFSRNKLSLHWFGTESCVGSISEEMEITCNMGCMKIDKSYFKCKYNLAEYLRNKISKIIYSIFLLLF